MPRKIIEYCVRREGKKALLRYDSAMGFFQPAKGYPASVFIPIRDAEVAILESACDIDYEIVPITAEGSRL